MRAIIREELRLSNVVITKMGKKIIVTFIVLLVMLFIGWWYYPTLFEVIFSYINKLCNEWASWVYLGLVILVSIGGNVYGTGYSLLRRKYLTGTFIWMSGAMIMLAFMLFLIHYTAFVIFLNKSLDLTLKLILISFFVMVMLPYLVLCIEKWMDLSTFFKDIWNHRAEYRKITYRVEEKGKLVYIHLDKHGTSITNFHEPAPTLKIKEIFLHIRKNPDESLALSLKSAFLLIVP